MAASNLQIQIQAFVQGLQQIQQLGQNLTQAGQAAAQAGQSASGAGAGFAGVGKGAGDAASQLAQFVGQGQQAAESFNKLMGLAKAAAVAFASFAAVASLKDAADIAARNETLGVTMEVIGRNAGYSKEELSKYEKELKGLGITTSAARESMISMMQAGLQIGPASEGAASSVAKLARTAQDLAVVQGTNSSETLRGLIRNIQQLDTEGLRMQGIVVDLDAEYDKFAQTLGKSAGALTTAEKQQAAFNAVQEKGKGLAGAYEASLNTVGKKLGSMARLQEQAAAAIGESLLPAYTVLVDTASAFLVKVEAIAAGIAENGKVAEVLKNILKSVLDFAGQITGTLVSTVQSIAPHIEEAFSKIQAAFEDIDTGGLVDGFQAVVKWATDLGTTIVDAIGNAAPSIRLLYDAFMMVVDSVAEAVREVMGFSDTTMDSVTAGKLLSTVLQGLGLLVAGFADGLSIVKAVAEIMFAGLMVGFGAIANVIGDVVGLVDDDLGAAFKQVGDAAIDMGMKSAEAAAKTFKSFADGETYVQKYADKLKDLPDAHRKDAEAADKAAASKNRGYEEAQDYITQYIRKVNEGKLKGEEAQVEYKKLVDTLNEMQKTYGFTAKEMDILNESLKTSRDKAIETSEAVKTLGLKASELKTGMSEAGKAAVAAFNAMVKSGEYTGEQLYQAFKKALSFETSLAGLKNFKESVDDAFKNVKISADQYGSALQEIGGKFDDLFKKQLAAAKTKEDFAQLEDQVRKLGGGVDVTSAAYQKLVVQLRNGTITSQEFERETAKLGGTASITGQQMSTALAAIKEKASGAREEMQRLAQQATALAEAGTRLAQADLAVTRAAIDVQRAKNALIQAENRHKEEGTALSRAELEVARLNVQLAEQKARLVVLQRDQEKAAMEVLIAQQRLLNAEKEAELKIGDANAQGKVDAAQKEVEGKQLALEKTNQAVEAQKQNVATTEEAAAQAQALAENLRQAASNASQAGDDIRKVRDWVRDAKGEILQVAAYSFDNVVNQFKDMGLSLQEASNRATELMGGMKMVVGSGLDGAAAYQRISDALKEAKDQMEANAEAARKVEEDYRKVAENAEDIANGTQENSYSMSAWSAGADAVAEAYRRIRKDARDAAEAAKDAARSFVNSAMSIREELLTAQGREDEAAKLRYAQRKKELELEYQVLEVKIQASIIQAKAAGIDTNSLEKSLADVRDAFGQAKKDLAELERLELEKIRKTREEQAKADKEKYDRAKNAAKDEESDAYSASVSAGRVASAVGGSAGGVQSIAASIATGPSLPGPVQSPTQAQPIQVIMNVSGVSDPERIARQIQPHLQRLFNLQSTA